MLRSLLRHERLAVVAGLVAVTALAWLYLLAGAGMEMADMSAMAMPAAPAWTIGHGLAMFVMWLVMMAAMMLPSASPMLLLYDTMARRRRERGGTAAAATAVFGLGYLTVWGGFSAGAVGLQYGLERAGLLSGQMQVAGPALGGGLLVLVGLYQWTPLKRACLRHCRSPLDFAMTHWREGTGGAFRMGLEHGLYCLGCCWVLMLLLFVGGAMHLAWIAGIALFVLAEKMAPGGGWLSRAAGLGLIAWGAMVLLSLAPFQ